jgi:thiamine transport system substrate-binding protein
MTEHRHVLKGIVALTATLSLAGCTLVGGDEDEGEQDFRAAEPGSTVVLVTHDSFALPEALQAKFEKDSGLKLEIRQSGDAGALTSKLVLNQDNPLGDVAFGVDNTFASRAIEGDVFADYQAELPEGAEEAELDGDGSDRLTPVDQASVCVNADRTWFGDQGLTPPETLADLAEPAYKDLFVAPGATTSSPGMAFLLATIAEYGEDGWQDYWAQLMANGAKLTSGWEDAYFVDFTGGAEKGTRPLVVSYDTSPAFTVDEKTGESTTAALLDTCFRQVEYAGVLQNAENPAGGEELVDFLVSPEVQAALPESMFVFPVDPATELPPDWAKFAVQPDEPYSVDPGDIAQNRDEWLTDWRDVTSR